MLGPPARLRRTAVATVCFLVVAVATPSTAKPFGSIPSTDPPLAIGPSAAPATACEPARRNIGKGPGSYHLAEVVSPANDAAVRSNAGHVTVLGRIDPQPHCGHRVQLLLDGAPAGSLAETPRFSLKNIDRGTHQLQLRIVDTDGTTLFMGKPSSFHLLRHSRLHP